MSPASTKKECFLSLGSNLGDRMSYFKKAISWLAEDDIIIRSMSSVYETEPVDMRGASYFYNMVLKVETVLSPEGLLGTCLRIERSMGRKRRKRNESRILDIDILFYSKMIIKREELQIPHPRAHLRRFVLVPLREIAPDFVHPTLLKSVDDLLKECPDRSSVRKCMNSIPLLLPNKERTIPIGDERSQ